jgi:hypothetical protein
MTCGNEELILNVDEVLTLANDFNISVGDGMLQIVSLDRKIVVGEFTSVGHPLLHSVQLRTSWIFTPLLSPPRSSPLERSPCKYDPARWNVSVNSLVILFPVA